MLKQKFILSLIVSVSFLSFAFGQEPLSTDRPDATEGTHVMANGVLQFELGYGTTNYEGDLSANDFLGLIRYGLTDNFEFRFSSGHSLFDFQGEESSGLLPFALGFKTNIVKEGKYIPAVSFLGELALSNTGGDDFKLSNSAPSFRFTLSKGINDAVNLGANIGMQWNGFDANPTTLTTLVAGISLTKWLGVYLELESYIEDGDADNQNFFNFGTTIWLVDDTQLDFSYSLGLGDNPVNNAFSIGVSQRLFK